MHKHSNNTGYAKDPPAGIQGPKVTTMSKANKLLVAAIDFGTTYSGYAFSFKHDYDVDPIKISANTWAAATRSLASLKTPTTVLFDQNQQFSAFGYEAEDKYSELAEDGDNAGWYYFKRFKMMLFDRQTLERKIEIKDINDKPMPALTVFSAGIKYLKGHLMKTLNNRGTGVLDTDIHWVLTVPAIWKDSAKQFMREAAELAGIAGDQLTIALEPEAASLYCKYLPVDKLSSDSASAFGTFTPGSKYMVVDCGGGTVDITVHEVQQNCCLKELYKASGGAWGGTMVDEGFRQMLIRIVGGHILTDFSHEHTSDYIDMFREFETKKRNIKNDTTNKVTIKIPICLLEMFEKKQEEDIKESIEQSPFCNKLNWTGDKCRLHATLFKKLFEDVGEKIVEHIRELLKEDAVRGVDKMIMVGGFSESPLLQQILRSAFPDIQVIIPQEAGLAVLKGAVLFGHKPDTIESRVAKYTYGVSTTVTFDSSRPASKKRMFGNTPKCVDVFSKHVEKGCTLKIGEVQSEMTYVPVEANQKSMVFEIFTSSDNYPSYVTDNGCSKIGQMEVNMPDTTGGTDRSVVCKMIFGGTEIEVEALEKRTGKVTRSKINFLD